MPQLQDTSPIHVKFNNQQNPAAGFDIIRLENLLSRAYADHSQFQLHVVEFYLLILITEGAGQHTIDFKEYTYQTGSLFTIRKDQIHRFHPNKTAKGFVLLTTDLFMVSYLEKLEAVKSLQLFNEFLGVPKIQLQPHQFEATIAQINRIGNEYFNLRDSYSLGIIRSELHILITKLYRIKSAEGSILTDRQHLSEFMALQVLVEQQVTQYKRVKDYARLMGLSAKTLNTITKNIINKSAKEFIDEVCVQQIKRLLLNTDLSVKEISYQLGFEESTNFYKYFKRLTGVPPEQFRTNHR